MLIPNENNRNQEEKPTSTSHSMITEGGALQTRIEWIDVLRGVGIIAVVVGHVARIEILVKWLYSFHIPLFFFAAGLVYQKKDVKTDIKRRTQTLLVPYLSFGTIELLYWIFIERRFRESNITVFEAIIGFFLGEESTLDFNVHFWFIPCFFLTVVLFNVLMNAINNKRCINAIVVFISVLYALCGETYINLPWGIERISKYMLFFLLGYLFSHLVDVSKIKGTICVIIGIIIIGCETVLVYVLGIKGFPWFINASLAMGGFIVLSVNMKSKVLRYLGQASLVIMCFHGQVYRLLIKIVSIITKIDTDTCRGNLALVIIISAVTIPICLVIHQLVTKFTPWMLGKRSSNA